MKELLITSCGNSPPLAQKIAKKLKAKYSPLTISQFLSSEYLLFSLLQAGQFSKLQKSQNLYIIIISLILDKSIKLNKIIKKCKEIKSDTKNINQYIRRLVEKNYSKPFKRLLFP